MIQRKINSGADLKIAASKALQQAYSYADEIVRPDGHWCGELKSNATITAEYVFLLQALGLAENLGRDSEAICRYLLSEQNGDGSWGIAPGNAGEISTSVEAYLALKLLGQTQENSLAMQKAQRWITTVGGGVERVRVFTRVFLATFGLLPWSAVPQLPAELIFMPSAAMINIYTLSSWARSTLIPMLVVHHHQPIFGLPNEVSSNNSFLDELWLNPSNKNVPYHDHFFTMLLKLDLIGVSFTAIDKILGAFGGFRSYNPLRRRALDQCMDWIITHEEPSGDWAGIFPPMHLGILAYILEGYQINDVLVRRALEAIERFAWQDEQGKRIQACISPVWDTVLMAAALAETPAEADGLVYPVDSHTMRRRALAWVKAHQLLDTRGDWRIYRRAVTPGGFSFEYDNTWYPDVDDTAAAVIAFLKDDRQTVTADHVQDAVKWILGMQCHDGGWAAFDADNDKLFLNKIPFSDMDSLCDPPTADIVGRVLEALGIFMLSATETGTSPSIKPLLKRIRQACFRGIGFLSETQEINGSWYGRWGVNYIYGTSNVLCGLAYHCDADDANEDRDSEAKDVSTSVSVMSMVKPGLQFLLSAQNVDGGWGEAIESYRISSVSQKNRDIPAKLFPAPSTAAQTAWALLALIPYLSTTHPAIESGIRYLIEHQTATSTKSSTIVSISEDILPADGFFSSKESHGQSDSAPFLPTPPFSDQEDTLRPEALTWSGETYTGTGFPNHLMIGYSLYSHYFPMGALGAYLRARKQEEAGEKIDLSH
ncbi:MAG: hypothetical protein Q9160_007957 [Pyrenula sp. 1 TL-2023]